EFRRVLFRSRGAFARRTDQKRRPSSRSAPTSSFVVHHATRSCPFRWGSSDPIASERTERAVATQETSSGLSRAPPKAFAAAAQWGRIAFVQRKAMYLCN